MVSPVIGPPETPAIVSVLGGRAADRDDHIRERRVGKVQAARKRGRNTLKINTVNFLSLSASSKVTSPVFL